MKGIVLLSGGLDSTVSLHIAKEKTNIVLGVTFDYGQKAAKQEIKAAKAIAKHYKIKHKIIELPWLEEITHTALVKKDQPVPIIKKTDLLNNKITDKSAKSVWVPNRNGIFINIAAAYAESMKVRFVVTGFNSEEATTFPDNTLPFVNSIQKSLWFSTLNHVRVISYVQKLNKKQITKLAKEKNIPTNLCWSCYLGGEKPCGKCESCVRGLLRNEPLPAKRLISQQPY